MTATRGPYRSKYEVRYQPESIDFEPIIETNQVSGESLVNRSLFLSMVVAKKGVNSAFLVQVV